MKELINSGIYTITCITNGKIYVGFARNFRYRYRKHINALRRGSHDNCHLQNAWNKYGESAFLFEVLTECPEHLLTSEEHYWTVLLNTTTRSYGYNIRPTSPDGAPLFFNKEIKQKISEANKGRKKSKEERQKMSERMKGKPAPILSVETKERLRTLNSGKKMSMESRVKMSLAKKGRKLSPETIEKLNAGRRKKAEERGSWHKQKN